MPRPKGKTKLTPQELEERTQSYFIGGGRLLADGVRLYTVSGLCLWLGITRTTLCDYENNPRFSDTVKRAKLRIENNLEELAETGFINATVSIFSLKNNFHWSDKTDVNVNGEIKTNPFSGLTDEELRALAKSNGTTETTDSG